MDKTDSTENMDDTKDTRRVADPKYGIYPERYDIGDDQNLDTFCAVCGVPLRVMAEVLEIEKEKYNWCLDGIAIRPASLQWDTDFDTPFIHDTDLDRDWETERYYANRKPLEILAIQGTVLPKSLHYSIANLHLKKEEFEFYQWEELDRDVNKKMLYQKWIMFPGSEYI
ncbi:hypothetical protein TMatcc_002276 [Talaromyces marneffei ATCC 18224]|uniref:Uncharacterized protein n=1 Tax=Talaromyces marneffei (strain ATCC 18224 / CBS 334.59 / QM 7333) TaxID=441960 RepID=B6QJ70_TALMQ|nr:hypothetical protein PMAA_099980 [Talaromyces marneffei ATCC 18224]KAE8552255.1 hypothetical protein EYB25_006149 [Talaromyces marneffei]